MLERSEGDRAHRLGDDVDRAFDCRRERPDFGLEPPNPSGVQRSMHVGTRDAGLERLDCELGPDDRHADGLYGNLTRREGIT